MQTRFVTEASLPTLQNAVVHLPAQTMASSSRSSKKDRENPSRDSTEGSSTASEKLLKSNDAHRPPTMIENPYLSKRTTSARENVTVKAKPPKDQPPKRKRSRSAVKPFSAAFGSEPLQAGIVLEEDVDHQYQHSANNQHTVSSRTKTSDDEESCSTMTVDLYVKQQRKRISEGQHPELFHDEEFPTLPSSIQGPHKQDAKITCRCRGSIAAKLSYQPDKETGRMKPFYKCAKNACKFYRNAYQAQRLHWYRLGTHTGHDIVGAQGFSANDLCQGRVGDCWFLSALAVVAERPDLILRLFGNGRFTQLHEYGICQVNLFMDGYWKTVTIDNFLPCLIDEKAETQLQQAIQASLGNSPSTSSGRTLHAKGPLASGKTLSVGKDGSPMSSKYNPSTLSDQCRKVLRDTQEFLQQDMLQSIGSTSVPPPSVAVSVQPVNRPITSEDLAYSKAKNNQLWVQLLEKAYAKSHGSYQAISGGWIAEAFLDLTGAPTRVFNFDSPDFYPRSFWSDLMRFRRQRLPMGCGTDSSAVGIIGGHAYSILDVVEVKNVSSQFFQETGVAHGNVSGFTEFDGTVRLLQIRNPHGKSEWKGDFSDHSDIWEKLLRHQGGRRLVPTLQDAANGQSASTLERTMRNDGKFWIDYDSFLMGFSNVDVVLAFLGNHAKSFASNFPAKKSNHRCMRAFQVSLLDAQPGLAVEDSVELYIMGIQKTRRGASHGRADRKKSYKVCDLGLLVGTSGGREDEIHDADDSDLAGRGREIRFDTVQGQMFGFQRNGHYRLVLDRKRNNSLVVMPISFGHPAATDKELSFVLRFVSDAPLLIRELPTVPRLDYAIQSYCLSYRPPHSMKQGLKTILLEGPEFRLVQVTCLGSSGGTVFLYLCLNQTLLRQQKKLDSGLSFSVEAKCRGMTCRTDNGISQHETIAKGKKFEASWRKYSSDFHRENHSRLLLVLYQSGQDYEFGSLDCQMIQAPDDVPKKKRNVLEGFLDIDPNTEDYLERGIFSGVPGNEAFDDSCGFSTTSLKAGAVSLVELDMEQAVSQSQDELELQRAIEASTKISGRNPVDLPDNNDDLHRAIALSMQERGPVPASSDDALERVIAESKNKSSSGDSFADDLERAIQLSMQETNGTSAREQSTESDKGMIDLSSEEPLAPEAKRAKVSTAEQGATIIDKRRLAAEAAMKRLERK